MSINFPIFPQDDFLHKNSGIGHIKKNILILVKNAPSSLETELLNKILSALNFNIENDALLVAIEGTAIDTNAIIIEKEIKYLISFGNTPDSIGVHLNISSYNVIKHLEVKYLFSHSLMEISNNKNYKVALWNALKEMFKNQDNG